METSRALAPWEFQNSGSLPVFTDVKEGLDFLDEQEQAARDELEAAARERMALDQEDPREQQYFRREDKKTVVRTEEEFVKCQLEGVRMTVIPYSAAVQALKEQEARGRQDRKAKEKKKAARKARKRNR